MTLAFNRAVDGWNDNEVPIGAVVVAKGEVVGSAYNRVSSTADPTAHAEIIAITQAATAIGDWRLNGATLYVTKEPCPMCSGACIISRVARVVYAVSDPKMGCLGGATNLNEIPASNHHFVIDKDVMADECLELIQAFFRLKREKESVPPGC